MLSEKPATKEAIIAALANRANAATSGARFGSILRTPPQTSGAAWAPRKRRRRDVPPKQPPRRQRSPSGWRAQRQSRARSTRWQSPHTWGCARTGKNPPPPIALAEQWAQVCPVRSTRSPRCNAELQKIQERKEPLPANASLPRSPFLLGTQAIQAAARTKG